MLKHLITRSTFLSALTSKSLTMNQYFGFGILKFNLPDLG